MFLARSIKFSVIRKIIFTRERSVVSVITTKAIMESHDFRSCSTYLITQNILLTSSQRITIASKENSIPKVNLEQSRPMIVLLEYMNAKKKHVNKIADIYLDQGFDVLQVSLKPLQLLFPPRGSQVIAKDLAEFLVVNNSFSPLVIHGFSVGGYLWGETLVHFKNDISRYHPVVDRIKGQIFDSPADIEAIPYAFPSSVFPNNALLRSTFQKYLRFHLKIWSETSTQHYYKSREAFTSGLVKAPTLFITSNADDLSSPESVLQASKEILQKKLESYVKVFHGSKHVMHFKTYADEYISEVKTFLKKIGLLSAEDSIQFKSKL